MSQFLIVLGMVFLIRSAFADEKFDSAFLTGTAPKIEKEITMNCSGRDSDPGTMSSPRELASYLVNNSRPLWILKPDGKGVVKNDGAHVVNAYVYDSKLNALVGSVKSFSGKGDNYSVIRKNGDTYYEQWLVSSSDDDSAYIKSHPKSNMKPGTVIYQTSTCKEAIDINAAFKKVGCTDEQIANINQWAGFFRNSRDNYRWTNRKKCPSECDPVIEIAKLERSWLQNLRCKPTVDPTILNPPVEATQ